jgi:hypothetical protein
MIPNLSLAKILLFVVTDLIQAKGKSNLKSSCKLNTVMSMALPQSQVHLLSSTHSQMGRNVTHEKEICGRRCGVFWPRGWRKYTDLHLIQDF